MLQTLLIFMFLTEGNTGEEVENIFAAVSSCEAETQLCSNHLSHSSAHAGVGSHFNCQDYPVMMQQKRWCRKKSNKRPFSERHLPWLHSCFDPLCCRLLCSTQTCFYDLWTFYSPSFSTLLFPGHEAVIRAYHAEKQHFLVYFFLFFSK